MQAGIAKFQRTFDATLQWLGKLPAVLFVLVVLAAVYAAKSAAYALYSVFDKSAAFNMGGPQHIHELSLGMMVFIAGVVAPIVETLALQTLPLWLLHGKFKLPVAFAVAVSSLLFAVNHTYSIGYALVALAGGVVLAAACASQLPRWRRATLLTCIVHALQNGVAIVLLHYW